MSDMLQTEVLADPPAVATRAAQLIVEHARKALIARGKFAFAVSGGSTPWAMFAELAREDFPWGQTTIYQVDERVAPAGDEQRNLTRLLASLPSAGILRVDPMPVEESDLDAAAISYAGLLPDPIDLIHLGLGPDGHTASLVPNDPVLHVDDRDVAITGPYQGLRRMTLTYPVLNRARALLWVVTGSDKRDALRRLREGNQTIPAGRVVAKRALLLADTAAVSS